MKNTRSELLWDTRQTFDFQYSEYINFTIFGHGKKPFNLRDHNLYLLNTVRRSLCVHVTCVNTRKYGHIHTHIHVHRTTMTTMCV